MNTKNAIERIVWRMNEGGWKSNENDEKAINTIIDFFNLKEKQQINDYELFAKLYIRLYLLELNHFKATVFSTIPKKSIDDYLSRDLTSIITEFTQNLNDSEKYSTLDMVGRKPFDHYHEDHIRDAYLENRRSEEYIQQKLKILRERKQKCKENLLEIFEDHPELKDHFLVKDKEIWKYDQVEKNLINQINETINYHENEKTKTKQGSNI